MLTNNLRIICAHEKSVYTCAEQLNRMKKIKKDVENDAEIKKRELRNIAKEIEGKIERNKREVKSLANFQARSIEGHITDCIWTILITVIAQLLVMFVTTGLFNIQSLILNIVICTVIYYLAMICLRERAIHRVANSSKVWDRAHILYGCFMVLNLAVMLYHKLNNINMISAYVVVLLVTTLSQVLYAFAYCKDKYDEYDDEYYRNKRKLEAKKKALNELEGEYKKAVADVEIYEKKVSNALQAMQLDIVKQAQYVARIETRLRELYSKSELHPKYQNWVAVATIYEYLDTGRCYELKGHYGAYNLYEQEAIAKKILTSLSAISHTISYYSSGVYESQSYIKQQLAECNSKIEQISVNKHGL